MTINCDQVVDLGRRVSLFTLPIVELGIVRRLSQVEQVLADELLGNGASGTGDGTFGAAVNGFLIEASGTDIRELDAIGIVAETSCRFLRELSFPETVHAGLALEKLGNSSVIYRIGLFRNDDVEPAALGRFVHVYVDSRTRRPVPVPASIRAALLALDEGAVGTSPLP